MGDRTNATGCWQPLIPDRARGLSWQKSSKPNRVAVVHDNVRWCIFFSRVLLHTCSTFFQEDLRVCEEYDVEVMSDTWLVQATQQMAVPSATGYRLLTWPNLTQSTASGALGEANSLRVEVATDEDV